MTENGGGAGGLEIDVQYASDGEEGDPPSPGEVRRLLGAVLKAPARVGVRFATEAESRATNLRFAGKDRPANVLAFPYADEPLEGDVIICPAVVAAEAAGAGIEARHRFAHLLVHAGLHLLGQRHDSDEEARRMEAAEARILRRLGLPEPYARDPA